MKKRVVLTATGLVVLFSTTALAGGISIKHLPKEGTVTLQGTVESVENEREFTLRDRTGTIGVDIESGQSLTLKTGDEVTVTGNVDRDVLGTDINATDVDVRKGFVEGVKDTVKSIPGISTTEATAFNISELPNEGMVKVTGMVSDVDNEKKFTLKDRTGKINVDVKSGENAALTEGAEVTVIGMVDKGFLGKAINATQVIVIADASTSAQH